MARHDIGVAEADFWHMTPRQLDALRKRHDMAERRENERTALVCFILASIFKGKGRKPRFDDFMPKPINAPAKPKQSTEEMIAIAAAITKKFGGKDLRHLKGK